MTSEVGSAKLAGLPRPRALDWRACPPRDRGGRTRGGQSRGGRTRGGQSRGGRTRRCQRPWRSWAVPPPPAVAAPPPDLLPPFPGFSDDGLAFLRDLREHNDREWFKPRKATYDDELLEPLRMLVADLSRRLPDHGLPLTADPRKGVFRIYRDTRFSKNKTPYKTHVSAVLGRGGDKKAPGALYVHVEPGGSRVGGGFWQPESPFLRRWRERMVGDPQAFLDVAQALRERGLRFQATGANLLKRMPRGFESFADSPVADYLRWKAGFVAFRDDVPDDQVQSPAFTDLVVETADALRPLLDYGWSVLDGR